MKQIGAKKNLRIRAFDSAEVEEYRKRFDRITVLVIVVFAIFFTRLWYLQIIKGNEYLKRSDRNCLRIQYMPAPRGDIFDRQERVLVQSRPSFSVSLVREDVKDINKLVNCLSPLLKKSPAHLWEKIVAAKNMPRYMPIRLCEDVDLDTVALVEMFKFEMPGVTIEVEPKRSYVYGYMASHLFGYLGEINDKELKSEQYKNVRMGELIGRCGLEKIYQRELMGKRGGRQVEVDAAGRVMSVYGDIPPAPGNKIYLTLDSDLQRVAEDAMAGRSGAVAAMDPRNGKILVWASCPNINLESFVQGLTREEWLRLLNDPLRPLPDKIVQGQYPPGSSYKIITMAAALEEKVIDPVNTLYCSGYYRLGNRTYRCWEEKGHGSVDVHKAIVRSCDVYFYEVGRRLGVNRLAHYARSFGLGKTTQIELPEKSGLVPTSDWKSRRYKVPWQEGETLSVAIGQGFNLVTPLQMLGVISAVANGGVLYCPQFVEKIVDLDGKPIKQFKPIINGRISVSKRNLEIIRDGLFGVVNEPHGTGGACRLSAVMVGGKTGTAQVVRLPQYRAKDMDAVPYKYRDHAWFIAFAPVDDPEIAIAVLVEHGGHGGSAAAPVAKAVLEEYFSKKTVPEAGPGPRKDT